MKPQRRLRRTGPSEHERLRRAEGLAVTWFQGQLHRHIPHPGSDHEGWVVEHERLYGVARYDERVDLLRTVLAVVVADGLRLGAVLAILRRAKRAQFLQSFAGAQLDAGRPLAQGVAHLQDQLDRAADLLAELHRSLNPGDLPATAAVLAPMEHRIREAIREHPVLRHYDQRPFRRARAGAPSRPWVTTARQQLARVGVRPDLRDNLLEAVGLIPYKPTRG